MFFALFNNYITSFLPPILIVRNAALNLIIISGTALSSFACVYLLKTFFKTLYSALSSLSLYKCFTVGQLKPFLEAARL